MCHNGFSSYGRSIKLAIEMIDTKIEDAARTLGANPIKVFYYNITYISAGYYSGLL